MKGEDMLHVHHGMDRWDLRFLRLAREISGWSKDLRCKVGCVFTSPERRILATGYNGLPRKVPDALIEEVSDPITKGLWFEHAERNGIYNASYEGVSLAGSTCYSTQMPCADCSRGIIQCGCERVVLASPADDYDWTDVNGINGAAARDMLWRADVLLVAPTKRLLLMQEDV